MNSSRPLIDEDEEKAANRHHNIESKLLRKASTRKDVIRYQSRRKKPNYEKQNLDVADEIDEDISSEDENMLKYRGEDGR